MDDLLLDTWAEPGVINPQCLILRGKSPPTNGAISDALFPGHVSSRGRQHARLVGSFAGRSAADRAFAQFLLRPIVRLLLDIHLDQLPSHLVTERTSDVFQLREFRAPRKTVGIKFPRQITRRVAQKRDWNPLRISAASLPIFAVLSKLSVKLRESHRH